MHLMDYNKWLEEVSPVSFTKIQSNHDNQDPTPPMSNQGRRTVMASAAMQVAATSTALFDLWPPSVWSIRCSLGSFSNSRTSTSYRNRTLDASRRQNKRPESRRSRLQSGSIELRTVKITTDTEINGMLWISGTHLFLEGIRRGNHLISESDVKVRRAGLFSMSYKWIQPECDKKWWTKYRAKSDECCQQYWH